MRSMNLGSVTVEVIFALPLLLTVDQPVDDSPDDDDEECELVPAHDSVFGAAFRAAVIASTTVLFIR